MLELSATFLVVAFFLVFCLALALAYSDNPRPVIPRILHRLAFVLAERVLASSQGLAAAASIDCGRARQRAVCRATGCMSLRYARKSRAIILKRSAERSIRDHIPDQCFWIVGEELMSSDGRGSVGFCGTTKNRIDTSVS